MAGARVGRVVVMVLTATVAAAGVLAGAHLMAVARDADPKPAPLDARAVAASAGVATPTPTSKANNRAALGTILPGDAVPGSARLVLIGPRSVLDTRGSARPPASAEATVRLPRLPAGSSAVLLQVSLVDAAGPGGVVVTTSAARLTVLRIPKAGAQTTATVVVPIGADGGLRVRTQGGGHLVVYLAGAFEPATTAAAGRIVGVPATEVVRLVPKRTGKDATIRVARVPALRDAAPAAVLLQIVADVGPHGGFVVTRPRSQELFWSATAGTDRTRVGLLVAPVVDGAVHFHYQAGSALTATLVGYLTGPKATQSTNGLVVPLGAAATRSLRLAPGSGRDVPVVPETGLAGVPAARVGGVLLGVTAVGDGVGTVTVHAPGATAFANPLVVAGHGASRSTLAVTGALDGVVRVDSSVGADLRVTPQALLLNG